MPWIAAILRGTRVLARCDASGTLQADGGRVEIRYKPNDGRSYRAAARNLALVDGEPVLPDDHCTDAERVAAKGASARAGKKGKKDAGQPPPAPPQDAIVAYTDGACSGNPGPAGLGVVLVVGEQVEEISEYLGQGTNNIADLAAIARAVDAIGSTERPVRIYTDSSYAIGVLTKGWKAKANRELIAQLRTALSGLPDVALIHVRGHAGVPLNERADRLAVAAIQQR